MAARILLPLLFFLLGSHRGAGEPAAAARRQLQMRRAGDPNSQVKFDFSPFLIEYKSGRVKRLMGTEVVAASADALTGVTSRDVTIDPATGVSARLYLPSFRTSSRVPVLVYFHGGAFVVESAFEPIYHSYLNTLAARAGVVAVSVNYRLAPEHPLPAAYDDSWAALKWVLANAAGSDPWLSQYGDLSRLFLAGDSAGGNIAHNLALSAGEEGLDGGAKIKGVALLDPYFQGRSPVGADAMDPAYLQSAARTWSFICAGRYPINHPYADPLVLPASSWQRFGASRVLVTVSELDRLSPWQRAYYAALRGSGWPGQAELYETPGEGHVYFLTKLGTPQALAEMAKLVAFINRD
ncbi:probable carboxylesterase 2 [Phragmites australis]|uniref:probable carboxylesterase 2 n=1 Tax=Phragmites australis TaxID=29695 RepID=UPI002D7764C7|nr:probable carboxylesterase 2 [Phragmites australis]